MKTTLKTVQKYTVCNVSEGKNDNEPIFYGFGEFGEGEQNASGILSCRHDGWYTDAHLNGLACGVIAEFPPRPGFPDGWFLAGYHWQENDERVYWPEVFAEKEEAARQADSHAEHFANLAREDSERFDEMQQAENKLEEVKAELQLILPARNVNQELRDSVLECIKEYKEARDELKSKTRQYENSGK